MTNPSTPRTVDHAYDCGCYWSSGNLVACPEHSPEQARISARAKAADTFTDVDGYRFDGSRYLRDWTFPR